MSIYPASIDDNDSQVLYSDGWELVTQDGSWTGTMHSTSVVGSWARVRFTGSRVAVVCTIPTGDGALSQASFSIDSGPAVQESHATTPPVQWQTVFWDSGPLPFASHLLVVTNTGNQAYFRLDHIDYDPTNSNAPPSSSESSSSTTEASTTTRTIVDSLPSPTQVVSAQSSSSHGITPTSMTNFTSSVASQTHFTGVTPTSDTIQTSSSSSSAAGGPAASGTPSTVNDSSASSRNSGVPIADIIAGVLGGLLALILAALAFYFLWIRRRRRSLLASNDSPSGSDMTQPRRRGVALSTTPIPFPLNEPPSSSEASTSSLIPDRPRTSSNVHVTQSPRPIQEKGHQHSHYRRSSPVHTEGGNASISRHSTHTSSMYASGESQPARPESHIFPNRDSLHQAIQQNGGGWAIGGGDLPSKQVEASGVWNTQPMNSSMAAWTYGGASQVGTEFHEAPPAYSGRVF